MKGIILTICFCLFCIFSSLKSEEYQQKFIYDNIKEKRSIFYLLNENTNYQNSQSYFLRKNNFIDSLYIFKNIEFNQYISDKLFISLNIPVRNMNIENKYGDFTSLNKLNSNVYYLENLGDFNIQKLHFFFGAEYLTDEIYFYISNFNLCLNKKDKLLSSDINDICNQKYYKNKLSRIDFTINISNSFFTLLIILLQIYLINNFFNIIYIKNNILLFSEKLFTHLPLTLLIIISGINLYLFNFNPYYLYTLSDNLKINFIDINNEMIFSILLIILILFKKFIRLPLILFISLTLILIFFLMNINIFYLLVGFNLKVLIYLVILNLINSSFFKNEY